MEISDRFFPLFGEGQGAQVVGASLRMSYLWDSMRHLKLVRNMRAKSDPWFAEYLLHVGGGSEEATVDDEIHLPHDICVPHTREDSDLDTLIDCLNANMSSKDYITSRAILSMRNEWVDMINMTMIGCFHGDEMVYHSFNCAANDRTNTTLRNFLTL